MHQGGDSMIRQQGGFKETIKKAFPEADFTTWGKPNSLNSSLKGILTELFWQTRCGQARTIPRDH